MSLNNLERFKDTHKDKIAICFGTGETLLQFNMDKFLAYRKRYFEEITRDDIICLGVNKIVWWDDVDMDYYFTSDNWKLAARGKPDEQSAIDYYPQIQKYIKDKLKREAFSHCETRNSFSIEEVKEMPANVTYLHYGYDIHADINDNPFLNHSIIFSTIQFAAYTGIRKIYIVGCDCNTSFFNPEIAKSGCFNSSTHLVWWDRIKIEMYKHYPDMEIISINPKNMDFFKQITI